MGAYFNSSQYNTGQTYDPSSWQGQLLAQNPGMALQQSYSGANLGSGPSGEAGDGNQYAVGPDQYQLYDPSKGLGAGSNIKGYDMNGNSIGSWTNPGSSVWDNLGPAMLVALGGPMAGAGLAGAAGGMAGWSPEMASAMEGMGGSGVGLSEAAGGAAGVTGGATGAAVDGMSLAEGAYPASITSAGATTGASSIPSWLSSAGSSLANGIGKMSLGNVLGAASGAYGAYQQRQAANSTLDYLKQRQAINDNMYAPGSPEYNFLWNEMSRKDAAAGRNSQYGPRSVDLAAKIAGLKMNANTQLTGAIARDVASANTLRGNSAANFTNMLPGLFGARDMPLSDVYRNLFYPNGTTNTDFYNGNLTPEQYTAASGAANRDMDPDFNGSQMSNYLIHP